jgi:hypothetical protein
LLLSWALKDGSCTSCKLPSLSVLDLSAFISSQEQQNQQQDHGPYGRPTSFEMTILVCPLKVFTRAMVFKSTLLSPSRSQQQP